MAANGETSYTTVGRGTVGIFRNVYSAPAFPFALLSVAQLLADESILEIGFNKDEVTVYLEDGVKQAEIWLKA